uniref:Putative serine incorporator n=1 Tax=Schistocephalus solidus TaxID=70667 RepID=A0A0X3NJ34_SCHSO
MGCIISSIACCFCNAAAGLCCACMPSCKNSTSTRIMNGVIVLIITVLSALCLAPGIGDLLKRIPALCSETQKSYCENISGYSAVYRICFAGAIYYFFMSLLMIRVSSSRDCRAHIHNGFWFFKIALIIGTMIGAFFITDQQFITTWMFFGIVLGFLYILVQLVLLVDFAHTWNEVWVNAYEETESRIYACALLFTTFFFYGLSIAAVVLFYIYFGNADACVLGKTLTSFNLILCVIATVVSILPAIQEKTPRSGLLQSSIITAYVMFLTWSALINVPVAACNPTHHFNETTSGTTQSSSLKFTWNTGISLVVLVLSVIYACIRNSSHTAVGKLTMAGGEDISRAETGSAPETSQHGQTVWDNEKDGVAYSYSMFNFMMMLAIMYVMMSLTQWYKPSAETMLLGPSYASVWVKAASSWCCIALYVWTLVAPVVFPDRDFS